MELVLSRQMFEKYSRQKFHGNSSSGSRVVPWDRETWRIYYVVAFRSFANADKNAVTQTVKRIVSRIRKKRDSLHQCKTSAVRTVQPSRGSLRIYTPEPPWRTLSKALKC
jgi:hypothetical protein